MAWPENCPFNPRVDLFGWHEKNKSRSKGGEWECAYSKKVFKSEHYIDLYLERNYAKEMPENGACLADYCQVFEFCNMPEPPMLEFLSSEPPECDAVQLEKYKSMCERAIDLCIVPEDGDAQTLNANLHSTWCARLTCESRTERHFHHRKWFIIIACIVIFFLAGIVLLCLCVDQSEFNEDDRKRRHSGRKLPERRAPDIKSAHTISKYQDEDVADIMPTNLNKNKFE